METHRSEDATGRRHRGARERTPSPLLWLPLDLIVLARVKHELVGVPGRHAGVALRPVVRNSIREDRARAVERRARHWARGGLEGCTVERVSPVVVGRFGEGRRFTHT